MCCLGWLYGLGCGTAQDNVAARQAFQQSADSGNSLGQAAYGIALVIGEGGPQDLANGLFYLKKSSDAGNALGEYAFGNLLPDSLNDEVIALNVRAEPAFAPAANYLSVLRHMDKRPIAEDPDAMQAVAAGDLKPIRNRGDSALAAHDFASSIHSFEIFFASKDKMIAWPRFNRVPAFANLDMATIDRFGLGRQASDERAAIYMNHALFYGAASFELAWMYDHGQGVAPSRAQALRLYKTVQRARMVFRQRPPGQPERRTVGCKPPLACESRF